MTESAERQYVVQVAAGEFIFCEGEPGKEMFIVQKGQVEILKKFRGQTRQVSLLEEGDFFGEMAILEDLPRAVSARAHTESVLLRIDDATFDQMVRRNPEIPVRMLRKLARRLRESNALLFGEDVGGVERAGTASSDSTAEEVSSSAGDQTNTGPRLVHASGTVFPLATGDVTIVGRADAATGLRPDIELSPVDPELSTSRRHAKIIRRRRGYFLREEIGTANGTYVDGVRVEAGAEVAIEEGTQVRFGLVTVVFSVD